MTLSSFRETLTFFVNELYCHVMTMSDDQNNRRWVMPQKNEKLDLRLTAHDKALLQVAARANHQSISDFVRESALRHAEETLPDRRRFYLNDEQWEAFQAALDAPPRYLPKVAKLFSEPSIVERGVTEGSA
jgi:uncharacterized protein (DUF1778 family)